ncbi:DUF6578 domain-containing protein [Actinoplanes xinjiangensis]|uniref:DUF6578 domain-containing protein n=1 Tax=Actinoplanes xinjiangensis TaxID=512350 RepID=UPI000D6AAB00|nr:DUF6578 domain-containing protein [Actinoplanes xinjiangensis]
MEITVWVDRADWNCCGEPFRIGSQVTWELRRDIDVRWLMEALGSDTAVSVDAFQYHHGDTDVASEQTSGTVARIRAVHWRSAPQTGTVPGSGVLTELNEADRGAPDRGDLTFEGFLVTLKQ